MKKTSVNRRKKLPLLLGALLIISVAAYGTRAYFSDSATQQANIELELGNVKISTDNTDNWKYTPLNTGDNLDKDKAENLKLGATKNGDGTIKLNSKVTNVRPGDSFTRNYVFTNEGSLDVKLDLKSDLLTEDNTAFVTTITDLDEDDILAPDDSVTYKVNIVVNPSTNNDYNNKEKTTNFNKTTVDYLTKTLTVKAVQTNADNLTDVN